MLSFKKTKIVCTLGPGTDEKGLLEAVVKSGMDVARFNFSHGTHTDHKERLLRLRKIEADEGKPIAVFADLQGPKIRLGRLSDEPQRLKKGETVHIFHAEEQEGKKIPIRLDIFPHLKAGHHVLINDGIIRLVIDKMLGKEAVCTVLAGGEIRSNKGINLPDTILPGVALTEKDRHDLQFIVPLGIEFVALSFVQSADDVSDVKEFLKQFDYQPRILAKIECAPAIQHLEEIIKVSDGVMVARGDMAVEIGQEEVPIIQRRIIRLCRKAKKPVIVATQMLESMIHNAEPTRAEVSDVATAVLEQADAVMLSAETAHGAYPVEAVAMMSRIINRVEQDFKETSEEQPMYTTKKNINQVTAIASSSCLLAHQLDAKLMFVLTATGWTAQEVSANRPISPIIAVTDDMKVYRQLCLVWGVKSFYVPKIEDNRKVYDGVIHKIKTQKYVESGDHVVMVVGTQPGVSGKTNSIRVATV